MTQTEANEILNRFQGWEPGRKCDNATLHANEFFADNSDNYRCNRCEYSVRKNARGVRWINLPHDIPSTDYFANTPEARKAVRLLKDDLVRQTHTYVEVLTSPQESTSFCCFAGTHDRWVWDAIEHHAVALAIADALKGQQ